MASSRQRENLERTVKGGSFLQRSKGESDSYILRNWEQFSYFTRGVPVGPYALGLGENNAASKESKQHSQSPSGALCGPSGWGSKHRSWGRGKESMDSDSQSVQRKVDSAWSPATGTTFPRGRLISQNLRSSWVRLKNPEISDLSVLWVSHVHGPISSARILAHVPIKRIPPLKDASSPLPPWHFTPRTWLGIGEHTLSQSCTGEGPPQTRTETWTNIDKQQNCSLPGGTKPQGNHILLGWETPVPQPKVQACSSPVGYSIAHPQGQMVLPEAVQNSFQETHIQWVILKAEREIKTFTVIQTLMEFITSRPSLKEMEQNSRKKYFSNNT